MGHLTGKTAIITGAGYAVLSDGRCGSIGYGIATAYAKEGANLVITGRNVQKLEAAKEEGTFTYDYGVLTTPHINDEIQSRSLSMTNCVAINGYGQNKEIANDFARFMTSEYNDILYDRTGKVSAAQNVDYGNESLAVFAKE